MASTLARHDDLLRAGIEAHSGTVFKHIGHGCCAASPTTGLSESDASASVTNGMCAGPRRPDSAAGAVSNAGRDIYGAQRGAGSAAAPPSPLMRN